MKLCYSTIKVYAIECATYFYIYRLVDIHNKYIVAVTKRFRHTYLSICTCKAHRIDEIDRVI